MDQQLPLARDPCGIHQHQSFHGSLWEMATVTVSFLINAKQHTSESQLDEGPHLVYEMRIETLLVGRKRNTIESTEEEKLQNYCTYAEWQFSGISIVCYS